MKIKQILTALLLTTIGISNSFAACNAAPGTTPVLLGFFSRTGSGSSSSFTSQYGHAWITSDITGSENTYGLWPDGETQPQSQLPNNLCVNHSNEAGTQDGEAWFCLSTTQQNVLTSRIGGSYGWSWWYNCASFAEETADDVLGIDIDADSYLGFETPDEFLESITEMKANDSNCNYTRQDPKTI